MSRRRISYGEDSDLRVWLNESFERLCFSPEELKMVDVYWVRNPGIALTAIEAVLADGDLCHLGVNSEDKRVMVRPVVKVRL